MSKKGQLNWVFAHGDKPEFQGYEEITVTNLNEVPAHLTFDLYFEDREPLKGLTYTLGAERVFCFKLDKPFCDQEYNIPFCKYSLVLHSDLPVVASFLRQTNATCYNVQGYCY